MDAAQKTTISVDSSANSKRGVSGALIEYIRSGIGFITIFSIFGLKTTSFPWPNNKESNGIFVKSLIFINF